MPPAERAARPTEWMKNNLQLTAEQEKFQEINLKYANKTEQLRNSDESRNQKFNRLKSHNEAKETDLKVSFT
ncbi:MAG TPA: hypothetical protein VK589_26140 [Chryseolinea sp.]|nr:hypothetical protein [Chryseolinea sp.]